MKNLRLKWEFAWGNRTDFIQKHNLWKYKLTSYSHLMNPDFNKLVNNPCVDLYADLDYNYITLMKKFRHNIGTNEKEVCERCSKNHQCKLSFAPYGGTPTLKDLINFSFYVDDGSLAESLDSILKKVIHEKDTGFRELKIADSDQVIPTGKVKQEKKKITLDKKLLWRPTVRDKKKTEKLSKV